MNYNAFVLPFVRFLFLSLLSVHTMSEDDTMSISQHPDGEPILGQTVYVSIASLCLVMLSIMLGRRHKQDPFYSIEVPDFNQASELATLALATCRT